MSRVLTPEEVQMLRRKYKNYVERTGDDGMIEIRIESRMNYDKGISEST